jgi:hypothetical protein
LAPCCWHRRAREHPSQPRHAGSTEGAPNKRRPARSAHPLPAHRPAAPRSDSTIAEAPRRRATSGILSLLCWFALCPIAVGYATSRRGPDGGAGCGRGGGLQGG